VTNDFIKYKSHLKSGRCLRKTDPSCLSRVGILQEQLELLVGGILPQHFGLIDPSNRHSKASKLFNRTAARAPARTIAL